MSKSMMEEILGPKEGESESSPGSLHACMHEFIEAVHARNVPDAVSALKACLAECDMDSDEEHEE